MEYRCILCPIVDGSEISGKATDMAAYLAKISGARLILLYVMEKWYNAELLVTDSKEWQDIHKDWLNEGRGFLEQESGKLRDQGIWNIKTELRDGEASYEILTVANEQYADIIVMGDYSASKVKKFFTGTVIDRVSRHARCPILWVTEPHEEKARPYRIFGRSS